MSSSKKLYDPSKEEYELQKGTVGTVQLEKVNSHDEISIDNSTDLDKTTLSLAGSPSFDEEQIKEFFSKLSDESVQLFLKETGHGNDIHNDNKDDLTFDLKFILDKIINMNDEKVLKIYQASSENHQNDPNFPNADWTYLHQVLNGEINYTENFEENFKAKLLASLIYYHSPYPEVRAVTDLYNDPNEPVETIRSYTIAIIWLIISTGIREFFYHRQPAIALSVGVVSILMYPCGKAWEYIMPNIKIGKLPLNPGPYSYKEQMFATTIVTVGSQSVYVSSNIVTQIKFYHQDWVSFGYQVLLTLSTQTMGFAFAGILRKFVIYPERALWPTNLPSLALNRALLKPERKEIINGWKITKYKFFWICFCGMFVYNWIPTYLFNALSTFSWLTWISPNNFNLDVVTGFNGGLGLNPIPTFDWNVVSYLISPLVLPFYVSMNVFAGMVLSFFVILAIYYTNTKWSAYLPINSNGVFTNTGESFEVQEILTNGLLDLDKYQAYSPPFYTAGNLVVYAVFFLFYPLSFVYNTWKEWDTIKFALKFMYNDTKEQFQNFSVKKMFKYDDNKRIPAVGKFDDPHSRMMARYKETPDWCYWCILIVSLVLAILCVKIYPETKTPVWGIFFAIGINFVFLIPLCLLYAVTGIQMGLNVLVELIVGYALPGNGVALMTIKALGYNIDGQADNFVSSQKMAHYAKIPARALFRGQLIGVIIQCFVFLGVVNWSLSNIEGLCEVHQKQKFTCPQERTFYSASVLWGVIGPKRVFDGLYPILRWAFLIGFLLALLLIVVKKYFPKYFPSFIEPQVFAYGMISYAPYNLSYIVSGVYTSFAFMYIIRRRYLAWFEKYNYVLSSAFDAGVAFSAVIIFFAVQYHAKNLSWWGNNVVYEGIEGGEGQQSLKDITESVRGYFGPSKGSFP